jgi:hypothetical protein
MNTTRNLSIRKAILATVAVAGLVAGTAACGGKNSDTSAESEKQALIEALLDAARNGAGTDLVADIIDNADPNLVAQVLPEIEAELETPNVTAPETAVADPAVSEAADDVVAPEESDPEVATPDESATEVAEEVVEEEVVDEEVTESAPESGSSGGGSFPRFPNVSLPSIPLFIPTPQVEGVMFWAMGDTTKVTVMIDEKSPLTQADIVEVKVVYSFLGSTIVDYATQGSLVGTNVWSWIVEDSVIEDDTEVTITVKNAAGKTHTYTTVASLSAPL